MSLLSGSVCRRSASVIKSAALPWLLSACVNGRTAAAIPTEPVQTSPADRESTHSLGTLTPWASIASASSIPLPFAAAISTSGSAFRLVQDGPGRIAWFQRRNTSSTGKALLLRSEGSGPVLKMWNAGTGIGAWVQTTNAASTSPAQLPPTALATLSRLLSRVLAAPRPGPPRPALECVASASCDSPATRGGAIWSCCAASLRSRRAPSGQPAPATRKERMTQETPPGEKNPMLIVLLTPENRSHGAFPSKSHPDAGGCSKNCRAAPTGCGCDRGTGAGADPLGEQRRPATSRPAV